MADPGAVRDLVRVWALGFALFALLALWQGEDVNWDLQNYHDYGPYALLHGRLGLDAGAAGIQGYFNPLPYLPSYALRHLLPPEWAALGMAAVQALVAPVAWAMAGALAPSGPAGTRAMRALAAVTALAGAMALSEVGTSFADLALAAPVLLGLLLVIRAWGGGGPRLFLLAGALVGAAIGLKLTNAVFAFGLAAATVLPWRGLAAGLGAAWRVAAGGLAGFLLTGGAWAATLWLHFGNPVFPAMNGVFRSPSANPDSFADLRFVPATAWDALLYPLLIATGAHPTAEFASADPRLLLGLGLGIVALGPVLFRPSRPGRPEGEEARLRAVFFLLAATVPWLLGFAIHRYAIVLDILAGLLLVLLPALLLPGWAGRAGAIGLAALALAGTRVPDWGHRSWLDAAPLAPPALLAEPAAVLVTAHPMGIWASSLPAGSRFYAMTDTGLATGGPLRARIEDGLRAPPGGRLLTFGPDLPMEESTRATMAGYGVVPTGPCARADGADRMPVIACGAALAGSRHLAAPDLRPGERADFTDGGTGWTFLVAPSPPAPPGWHPAGPGGTAAENGARLVLRPVAGDAPLVLELELRAPGPVRRVTPSVEGRLGPEWDLGSGWSLRPLCLPPSAPEDGGVVRLSLGIGNRASPGSLVLLRRLSLREAAPGECLPHPDRGG